MKAKNVALSIIALLVLMSVAPQDDTSKKLIGTWKWANVINGETNEEMGIDMVTMGMASEVKTEFKTGGSYVESKLRTGATEYSTTNGEWKLEGDDVLNMKPKDKWRPSKILKFTKDSLIIQMSPKMNLLLVKQK
ncbi:lipocalin family protein [Flavobacterium sp.]